MGKTYKNPNVPELWNRKLFDENSKLLSSPFYIDKINQVAKFFRDKTGRLLDVGMGAGNLEKKLMDSNPLLKLYGIDFADRAIAYAKKNYKGKYIVTRLDNIPFKNEYFDFVAMLDVLEHIPKHESEKVLSEIYRIMKDNGDFVISVPLNEDLEEMNRTGINTNRHLRKYTPNLLMRELQHAGFETKDKHLIYAFENLYLLKNMIIKLFPKKRNPNLIIVYAKKR